MTDIVEFKKKLEEACENSYRRIHAGSCSSGLFKDATCCPLGALPGVIRAYPSMNSVPGLEPENARQFICGFAGNSPVHFTWLGGHWYELGLEFRRRAQAGEWPGKPVVDSLEDIG